MRSGGINWLAVLAAAVAIYGLGFLIYGVLIPDAASGADMAIAESRMIFGPLMPILTAVFLALLFKWGQIASMSKGAQWAAVVALASAIPTILYGWVYGGMSTDMAVVDCAHLFLGHVAAGVILGGWR